MRRPGLGCLLFVLLLLLPGTASARDSAKDANALAKRYVPILDIRQQKHECDHRGEGYRPTSVDVALGRRDVRLLRTPGKRKKQVLLKDGPTAQDIAGLGPDTNIDLPGNSLHPKCHYERLSRQLTPEYPHLTYAHIAREAGKTGLAVQYWFYWIYNQFTDLHESDWEMIQVEFPVDTVAEALKTEPSGLAYAQHAGGERAGWTDDKVHKVGTHPIAFPGAGSHADYYGSELYLGNGKSGFGCDDTTAPSDRLVLTPELVPTDPGPKGPDAWLRFKGRWGQRQKGFFNGPKGPNEHRQWLEPFSWSAGLREEAPSVPGGESFGPSASKVFCGAVEAGSKAMLVAADSAPLAIGLFAALALLILWAVRRTSWHRRDALPLGQPLAEGETLRAAAHLYRQDLFGYWGIGLIFIGAMALSSTSSALLLSIPGINALSDVVGNRIIDFLLTSGVSLVFSGAAFAFAYAAVTVALREVDAGGPVNAADAYRAALSRLGTLAVVTVNVVFVVAILALTLIGIPLAVKKAVDWAFATPEAMIGGGRARESLKASADLVKGRWWSAAGFALSVLAIGIVSGATVGILLIATTHLSLPLVNAISSVIYVFTIPYCAIAMTLKRYALTA